jgi:hypothetical protein
MISGEFTRGRKPRISLAELQQIIRDITHVPGWDEEDDRAALALRDAAGDHEPLGEDVPVPAPRAELFPGELPENKLVLARDFGSVPPEVCQTG